MKINNGIPLLFALVIINSLMFLYGFIMMDSARDISQAIDIATGANFPLLGPDIGGFAHVGPVWFYFLAIPALTQSLFFISLWVGFFSSLKFILAYQLGVKLLNERFAWLLICALCLPGWQSIDNMVLMHTNLVIVLTFAFLLCFNSCIQSDSFKNLKWLFLIFSLCIHAHPSTVVLGIFIIYLFITKWQQFNLHGFILAVLLFTLPFVPYIYDQFYTGFPDWQRTTSLVNKEESDNVFQRLPNFILSVFYYGPLQVRNFIAMWNEWIGNIVFLIYVVSLFVGFFGLIKYFLKGLRERLNVLRFTFLFLVLCLLLLLLRSFIPFYMMLVLVPFKSTFIAFGSYYSLNHLKLSYYYVIIGLCFIINLMPVLALTQQAKTKQFSFPNLSKIEIPTKFSKIDLSNSLDGISVKNAGYLNSLLCQEVYVHGPFSIVLDYNSAIQMRMACPDHNIKLSGKQNETEKHVFIMHKSFWDESGVNPEKWVYPGLGYTFDFINHSQSNHWELAPFDAYKHPQRKGMKKNPKAIHEYKFQTQANSVIVITNTLPFYVFMKVESVEINSDQNPELVIKNVGNWMYRCQNCDENTLIEWRIEVVAEVKDAIDINELIAE